MMKTEKNTLLQGSQGLIILVLVDYNAVMETRDTNQALELYKELAEKHQGTKVKVDLATVVQRNGGEETKHV